MCSVATRLSAPTQAAEAVVRATLVAPVVRAAVAEHKARAQQGGPAAGGCCRGERGGGLAASGGGGQALLLGLVHVGLGRQTQTTMRMCAALPCLSHMLTRANARKQTDQRQTPFPAGGQLAGVLDAVAGGLQERCAPFLEHTLSQVGGVRAGGIPAPLCPNALLAGQQSC
jgi:hypothetical protein